MARRARSRIELFDPLNLPEKLLKIASRLQRPTELVGADFEWVFPSPPPVAGACAELAEAGPCPACAAAYAPGKAETSRAWRLKRRRALLAGARAIRALDRMSEVFARRVFGDAFTMDAPAPKFEPQPMPAATVMPAVALASLPAHVKRTLAIVAPEPAALADRLIVSLGRALLRRGVATSIVVLGECVDDLAAMTCGNVFVAGNVATEEYERLLRQYEVTALMSPYRTRFFGRIDRLSEISIGLSARWRGRRAISLSIRACATPRRQPSLPTGWSVRADRTRDAQRKGGDGRKSVALLFFAPIRSPSGGTCFRQRRPR